MQRNSRMMVTSVVAVVATGAGSALAAPAMPHEMQLAPGTGGEAMEYDTAGVLIPNVRSGPGNEQPQSTWLMKDGKVYVVTVYMSSNITDRNGDNNPWQCKCNSVELSATAAPREVVHEQQLTQRNNDNATRPCNHPAVTSDGASVFWAYGSDSRNNNNNQVDTYVGILDHMCNEVQAPILMDIDEAGNNKNGNNGAPAIFAPRNGGQPGYIMASYLNDANTTYLVGLNKTLTASGPRIALTNAKAVVKPARMGRPSLAYLGDETYMVCAAKGANRPPEDGMACAVGRFQTDGTVEVTDNTVTTANGAVTEAGRIIAPAVVDVTNVQDRRYMNQPSIAHLGDGRVAVHVLGSNGLSSTGQNAHVQRGTTYAYIYTLQVNLATGRFSQVGSRKEIIGGYQSHSGLCAAQLGADPSVLTALYIDAPVTGSAPGTMTPFTLDRITNTWTQRNDLMRVLGSEMADSGKLQSDLGHQANAATGRGRDFMTCVGDVPNPGARVEGGFRPEVDTFILTPYVGRKDLSTTEPKNALFLTLHPGRTNDYTPPSSSSSSSGAVVSSSSVPSSGGGSSSGATTSSSSCAAGSEGCACFPGGTCYAGLQCNSGMCETAAGTSSSSSSGSQSSSAVVSSSSQVGGNASSTSGAPVSSGGGNASSAAGGGGGGGSSAEDGSCTCAVPGEGASLGALLSVVAVMALRRRRAR